MQIKAHLRPLLFIVICALLCAGAWGVSQLIPVEMRQTRWERAAANLSPTSPTAEVCAEVNVHFGVQLTAEDVQVWRQLCLSGTVSSEALRIVTLYRSAANR